MTLIPPLVVALALWAGGSPFVGGFLAALFAFALLATLASRGLLHAAAVASQSVSPELKAEPRPVRLEAHSIEADEDNRRSDAPKLGAARNGPTPATQPVESPLLIDEPIDEEDCERDPAIVQSTIRRQESDGSEVVEGAVRISFGAPDRTAVAHVSFIPPLSRRPRAECQVLVDFEGRVRVALSQAYGLRIEARRPESCSGTTSIDVAFIATVSAVQSAAA